MIDKESYDMLVSAIEDAGFEARSYSGRGMYGRECLGVVCDSPLSCVMTIVSSFCENASEVDEVKELVDALSDPSSESMGRDAIVYWPSIAWMGGEEELEVNGEEELEVDENLPQAEQG